MGFFNDLFSGNIAAIVNDAVRDTGEYLSGEAPLIEGGGFLGDVINMGVDTFAQPIVSVIPDKITGFVGDLMQSAVAGGSHPSLPTGVTVPVAQTDQYSVGSNVSGSDGKQYVLKSDGTWGDINLGGNSTLYIVLGVVAYLYFKKK